MQTVNFNRRPIPGGGSGSYMGRVILFNVQHGFCAFVKSPTGCTVMIDCGKGDEFSPAEYILAHELGDTVPHNG
jgi:hypothetical protein